MLVTPGSCSTVGRVPARSRSRARRRATARPRRLEPSLPSLVEPRQTDDCARSERGRVLPGAGSGTGPYGGSCQWPPCRAGVGAKPSVIETDGTRGAVAIYEFCGRAGRKSGRATHLSKARPPAQGRIPRARGRASPAVRTDSPCRAGAQAAKYPEVRVLSDVPGDAGRKRRGRVSPSEPASALDRCGSARRNRPGLRARVPGISRSRPGDAGAIGMRKAIGAVLLLGIGAGPARGAEPSEAVTIRPIRPNRQLERLIALFRARGPRTPPRRWRPGSARPAGPGGWASPWKPRSRR